MESTDRELRIGIDVGSTTVKVVITDAGTQDVLYARYVRHNAKQKETVGGLLAEAEEQYPHQRFRAAVCGSGGRTIAQRLGVHYIQEVVANSAAVRALYPQVRTAIELGGQDAKVVFFYFDKQKNQLQTSDMRMNGSCAGGTGAFIDEVAALLNVETEQFEALAAQGRTVYDISGRCGVFAKTDIQPLLLSGAKKEDIALSTFHAIAKQTIGGLAQGLELAPPIIFEGGPLTFNPTLIKTFAGRLGLKESARETPPPFSRRQVAPSIERNAARLDGAIVRPEHPETIVAYGTAIAIDQIFPDKGEHSDTVTLRELAERLAAPEESSHKTEEKGKPFFCSPEEKKQFQERHGRELQELCMPKPEAGELRVWLGIDSGSTTSKFVLLDEEGRVVDRFYAPNRGEALLVVRDGLLEIKRKYDAQGIRLHVLGLGTTGYGENLLARAFGADYHTVETVAHAMGCTHYYPETTFLLDIGGQDMKAIWLEDGIITNIMLNEACSSGCGSFLENFASSLRIPVDEIAETAFRSESPAKLGSRCTVFMNSTIITEQRNGKGPDDIMAGLCRSVIENVFTKVIRISDTTDLGEHVVVQGGTFRNQAVLRALEEYLGTRVKLAPYPGEMGAIGAALEVKRQITEAGYPVGGKSSFIGFDALEKFSYETQSGVQCTGCGNRCNRTVVTFSTGKTWVSGNRCEKGAVVKENRPLVTGYDNFGSQWDCDCASEQESNKNTGAGLGQPTYTDHMESAKGHRKASEKSTEKLTEKPTEKQTEKQTVKQTEKQTKKQTEKQTKKQTEKQTEKPADLFAEREALLFADYSYHQAAPDKGEAIGLPRVLEFWDSMPFWSTFFRALGYQTRFSRKSSRKLYEQGLQYVASDTVCFPAKLVHGHIMDLAGMGVDRIFFPYVMHMPPEGVDKNSPYVCSVLQGYPMVVRNSQNPEKEGKVIFDTPVFHWFEEKDRKKQICSYAVETLGVTKAEAASAFADGEHALLSFRETLTRLSSEIIRQAHESGTYAVVLAGRPYHTDPFICHDLSRKFTERGVPVLTVDSLPDLSKQDLKNTRIEITNDFHTRMLEGAMVAAKDPALEYVQIVSFGCGHDAILSDEISRILAECGNKSPLILKVDESDASGSLGIRIQSFLETIAIKRRNAQCRTAHADSAARPDGTFEGKLSEPSPAKFYKSDRKRRTILVPNISKEVSVLLSAIMEKENYTVKTLPIGGPEQIALGKKYVHNDICFPCQMVIGELISALQKGNYRQDEVAVAMVKFQCDCRMSHYAGLLRKGLDRAGFTDVPIVTTDAGDSKNMHPGVMILGVSAIWEAVWVFMMLDILTDICRKIRPYELHPGETDEVYNDCVNQLAEGIRKGVKNARKVFETCIDRMGHIPYNRSQLKPKVFVTGELLVTYHPGSNFNIERYLEANGMETAFPRITDQLRKDFRATECEIKDYHASIPPYPQLVEGLFDYVQKQLEKVAVRHELYECAKKPKDLYREVGAIIPETLSCGEGWLMAAEIAHNAKDGVKSFIILQPFGCLPNHVCGRGVIKRLKEEYPDISILPLDLDPDTSYANVENRLQMLIMNHSQEEPGSKAS
ncbi:MAG: acyl-CoA dehydratase activase [Lachnospiraceae bacterium]|nr:acyl-CoA dehydratase activase [Lachnospiraceae bacterium]